MSLSSILNPDAKNENWAQIYVNELNAANLSIDNIEAKSLTLGESPNQYLFPTPSFPQDVGQTLVVTASGSPSTLDFRTIQRVNMNFGAGANANPTYFVVGGTFTTPRAAAPSPGTNWRLPYSCRLTHLTIFSSSSSTSTQYNLYNNGGLIHSFTFPANGVYGVPTSLFFVAGEFLTIAWLGVGTQPNDTIITAFFSQ